MTLTRRGRTVLRAATLLTTAVAVGLAAGHVAVATAATYVLRAGCVFVFILAAGFLLNAALDAVEARAERNYQARMGLKYVEQYGKRGGRK